MSSKMPHKTWLVVSNMCYFHPKIGEMIHFDDCAFLFYMDGLVTWLKPPPMSSSPMWLDRSSPVGSTNRRRQRTIPTFRSSFGPMRSLDFVPLLEVVCFLFFFREKGGGHVDGSGIRVTHQLIWVFPKIRVPTNHEF